MSQRRAGIFYLQVNDTTYKATGEFTVGFGQPKRTAITGSAAVDGFSEEVQVPFIEGEITDTLELDTKALMNADDVNCTVSMNAGKTFILRNAWYAADGEYKTKMGNIQFRMEGVSLEEVV